MELSIEGANPSIDVAEVDHFLLFLMWANACKHVLFAMVEVKLDLPVVTSLIETYSGKHRGVLLLSVNRHP